MTVSQFIFKVRFRLWGMVVAFSEKKRFYCCLYRSYWHYRILGDKSEENTSCYYTALPNPGAGIGHQLANWLTGHWFAQLFGLKFAHLPLSSQRWEDFLGLGEGEVKVEELKKKGYQMRKLPLIDDQNPQDVALTKRIIQSYAGKKVVFIAEQDQNTDEFGEIDLLKQRFSQAKARQNDSLVYAKENFNIAVHVRRGDIVSGAQTGEPGMLMRWQDNDYFVKVLSQIPESLNTDRPVVIHLFSQGKHDDFRDFNRFGNIQFHLNMDAQDAFLHLVYADLLITSKSSFSYKPALMSNGIKISPRNFWHAYPDDSRWILAENDGTFDVTKLKNIL